jgi:hypothetical protein
MMDHSNLRDMEERSREDPDCHLPLKYLRFLVAALIFRQMIPVGSCHCGHISCQEAKIFFNLRVLSYFLVMSHVRRIVP